MGEKTEFEQLMKEKSVLEEESQRLDDEQKKLNLRAKMLCEKLIQEIKKTNSEKQQAVNKLQTRIGDLEAQLDRLSVSGTIDEKKAEKVEDGQDETITEVFEEAFVDTDESITVAEIQQEIAVDSRQERKKRKFF